MIFFCIVLKSHVFKQTETLSTFIYVSLFINGVIANCQCTSHHLKFSVSRIVVFVREKFRPVMIFNLIFRLTGAFITLHYLMIIHKIFTNPFN